MKLKQISKMNRDDAEEYLKKLSLKELKTFWKEAGGIRNLNKKEDYVNAIWSMIRGFKNSANAIAKYRSK